MNDSTGMNVIPKIVKIIPELDLDEAKLHLAIWHHVHSDFEKAICIYKDCMKRLDNYGDDPRAVIGYIVATRMNSSNLASSLRTEMLTQAKNHDTYGFLRGNQARVLTPVLFCPEASSVQPCETEMDYLFRKALRNCDDPMLVCNYGVFRYLIVKDVAGAEFFLKRALLSKPDDSFLLACFYGRGARGTKLEPLQLDVADFDLQRPASFTKTKISMQQYEVDVKVYVRKAISKWGSSQGVFDLLVQIENNGDFKHLILSYYHLVEWVGYIDKMSLLWLKNRHKLFKMILKSVDLVRTNTAEDSWETLKPALKFKQISIANTVQVTESGRILSLVIFLENCNLMRVNAFCAELNDSFTLVLTEDFIKQSCLDSPHVLRVLNGVPGWRDAVRHSKMIQRICSLLEIVNIKEEWTPKNMYDIVPPRQTFILNETTFINNNFMQRPVKHAYSSYGETSRPERAASHARSSQAKLGCF